MDPEQKEIDKILSSLDGIGRASANPFLYEKVLHRMELRRRPVQTKVFVRWAIALSLMVLLNVFTWTRVKRDEPSSTLNAVATQLGFTNMSYQY
jgi:hypothetical protein